MTSKSQSQPDPLLSDLPENLSKYKTLCINSLTKPNKFLISQSPILHCVAQELPSPIGLDQFKTPLKKKYEKTPLKDQTPKNLCPNCENNLKKTPSQNSKLSRGEIKFTELVPAKKNSQTFSTQKRKFKELPVINENEYFCQEIKPSKKSKSVTKNCWISESPIINIISQDKYKELETPKTLKKISVRLSKIDSISKSTDKI